MLSLLSFIFIMLISPSQASTQAILVGIAGGSASGKTTLAHLLTDAFQGRNALQEKGFTACYVSMDWYYRPIKELSFLKGPAGVNFDHPDSLDRTLVLNQLQELKEGHSIEAPLYSYDISDRLPGTQKVGPCKIVFFEGIYALYDERIRDLLDHQIFVSLDNQKRRERRIARDQLERGRTRESIEKQYDQAAAPMFDQFAAPTLKYATEVVDGESIFDAWQEIKNRIGLLFGL